MIRRENNYLRNKKKKYLLGSIVWLFIMSSIFITGILINKTRNNIFTVVAAVLVLPVAQYIAQLFAIIRFKDPDDTISRALESIQGEYDLFHGVIIPDQNTIINIDHIIVTGQTIYCIIDESKDIGDIKIIFNKKIEAKGVPMKSLVYIEKSKIRNMEKLLKEIEASAKNTKNSNKSEYTKLIAQMMM